MTPGVLLLLLSSPLNRPVLMPFTVIEMWTPPTAAPALLAGRAPPSCQATSASSAAATATASTRVRGRANADVMVSSPIATPVARGLRLFSRGSRETAPVIATGSEVLTSPSSAEGRKVQKQAAGRRPRGPG